MLQGFGFPITAILAILAISALCSFVSSVGKVPSCPLWFKFLPSGSDPRSSALIRGGLLLFRSRRYWQFWQSLLCVSLCPLWEKFLRALWVQVFAFRF